MQPINYMQGYQNPLESILNQVKMYQDFSQNANVLQSQREQNRITTAHNDRRIQAMNDLQGVDFNDENKLREWAGRYGDLEYGKGLNDYLGKLDEQAKKAEIGRVSQVYSLLRNGKDDVAIADLEQQALAYENAGDKANANGARQMAQLIRADRKSALMNVGMAYAHLVPKDTMDNLKDLNSAYAPNVQYQDMGGSMQAVIVDPITGEMKTQHLGDKTQSPDNYADNARALAVAEGGWDNAITVEGMRQDGAMERTQYQSEADLQKERMKQAYEAQKEKHRNSQILVDEDGYAFYYNPADPTAGDYIIDPQGNKVKKSQLANNEVKMATGDLKQVMEAENLVLSSQHMLNNIDKVINNLTNGTLDLGLLSNAWNAGRNGVGASSEASRAYTEMNEVLNAAVDQLLKLANGVQTEGDAQRASKIILDAPRRDNKVVLQSLQKLRDLTNQTIVLKQQQIQRLYDNAGVPNPSGQQAKDIASKYVSGM